MRQLSNPRVKYGWFFLVKLKASTNEERTWTQPLLFCGSVCLYTASVKAGFNLIADEHEFTMMFFSKRHLMFPEERNLLAERCHGILLTF